MEATLQRFENCGEYTEDNGLVNPEVQLCYSILGIAAACTGDIGGLIVFKKNGTVVCLIGISSFSAERCEHLFYPSVFTSAFYLRNWILRRMKSSIRNAKKTETTI